MTAPPQNGACQNAITDYAAYLTDAETFMAWTIEEVVAALREAGGGRWVEAFADRYLAFEKVGTTT